MATPQSLLAFMVLTVSSASSVKPSTINPTVTSFSKSIGRISRGYASVIYGFFGRSSYPLATSTTSNPACNSSSRYLSAKAKSLAARASNRA